LTLFDRNKAGRPKVPIWERSVEQIVIAVIVNIGGFVTCVRYMDVSSLSKYIE